MHKLMERVGRVMSLLGGSVLALVVVLTCLSVAGRALNSALHGPLQAYFPELSAWFLALGIGPITGDFELVEAGVAFAIFAFLPQCQLTSGHATVDLLTERLPLRAKRFLSMCVEIVFAATLIMITVQLFAGTVSKYNYGETTFLLQLPVWWFYAACLIGASVAAAIGIYMAGARIAEFASLKSQLIPKYGEDL